MKLIIDIPEYNLDKVQNGSIACAEILKAVKNGIPYETKGDLISREVLKEDFDCAGFNDYDDYKLAIRLIDNAPTVNIPNYGGKVVPDMLQGWRYEERPQDKWIKDNSGDRFCSKCGKCALYHEIGTQIESRFCPNCGAKMQKGGAV